MNQYDRAVKRAGEINMLTCNVGLGLGVVVRNDNGQLAWVIDLYDCGAIMGTYGVYKHERSAVRAMWREYRKRTGD